MEEESGRAAPVVSNGSAPIGNALEPPVRTTFSPLQFDPQEFMHLVEDEGLNEEEATMLLRAIWEVMISFLDLQLGIHALSHVVDRSRDEKAGTRQTPRSVLSSRPAFSKTAGRKSAARKRRTGRDS